ncbi:proline-rich transmembrane protein 4-like [Dendronephthya gigantea]|uniref:proline-rich transmembrane protein 4-like n=1 Tax=Dendronephthya gigantea TaxID=151771 RepID=UPI00106B3945|nr:proline-rich transmembrane protein 4-like [Dendronephthya gigantea]XP_028393650.1 proline-rich transmembrane protein 4-like [Dendronephthya gigantea]
MRFPRAEGEPESNVMYHNKSGGNNNDSNGVPEPEYKPAPNAEPVPEWPAAKEEWNGAWEAHYIGFGVLFLLLAAWSIMALIRARNTPLLVTRRFCYAINCLLISFGITRALALFLYPYEMVDNANGTPVVLQRLLFGIGYPCLIAGFTLIHYAFLEAAKVSFSKKRIQSLRFIIGVIAVHVTLVLVAEIVTSYVNNTSILVIICMLYFIVCSLAVSASVFYSGFHVIKESKTHRRTLKRISVRSNGIDKKASTKVSNKESNTNKVARVTMVTACLGVACAALQIYAMAGVFEIRSKGAGDPPKPWPWWVYVTLFRLVELGLASTMAYTVSQPKKNGSSNIQSIMRCCAAQHQRRETFTDSGMTLSETAVRFPKDSCEERNPSLA